MPTNYLALDVGRARIGLALANDVARIAAPLPALLHDDTCFGRLQTLIAENNIGQLVVGWPRDLNGQETEQTHYVEAFVAELKAAVPLPVALQDEALTSVKAEAELKSRNKDFDKADVDSLSAVYILEDYLAEALH